MKASTVAATLLAAAPSALAATGFYGVSARSGSPIHLQSINAADSAFWIGKPTASYCPSSVVGAENCPAGNETAFTGGDNTLFLDVEVPGGQEVYVASSGALTYTIAHSAYMPAGSTATGFHHSNGTASSGLGSLSFTSGFVACPTANSTTGFPYQIYAGTTNKTDCLSFDILTSSLPSSDPAAWQYA